MYVFEGAKLRIGEVKPAFRGRYGSSHSCRPSPPVFYLTLVGSSAEIGYFQMVDRPKSVVLHEEFKASTPQTCPSETASSRPGWCVKPVGRIIHPIPMLPEEPLPPVSGVTSSTTGKDGKKKRKREKPKLVRARPRTIDPTKWDSQHLKGAFLDSIVVAGDGDNLSVTAQIGRPGRT